MSSLYPVSVSRHGSKRWQRYSSYAFAAGDAMCPLVVQELPKAAMSLPLAFAMSGEEVVPVAVLGLLPGKNLFVAPDGRWLGGYVPAAYRGYPFALAHTEDGQQVLCVDESSGLLADREGELFFSENNQPAPALTDVLNFLTQVAGNRQATRRIGALLQEYGVVQSWPIRLQTAEGEQAVAGLWRVDEAALNALPAEAFVALRDAGALPMVYCQLLSMQHLAQLGPLAQAHERAVQQAVPQPSKELNLEFLNQGGTISFGNL